MVVGAAGGRGGVGCSAAAVVHLLLLAVRPSQGLAGLGHDGVGIGLVDCAQHDVDRAPGELPVGVLVAAELPGAVGLLAGGAHGDLGLGIEGLPDAEGLPLHHPDR